ncbi:hypothetical protein [Microbacterium hydrocarbonoxydans]|uniref:hypothetical protein n=1 Tax=Microbacterium hydrocarbonoxydans TaxID=273678 RepID=UPI00203C467C|nr:hypothetical protein [Microbacterium hydrocarbonoxydans]MCM3778768.1 hypothetical protein [Microbacterium hydrocarbonoxydans]
MLSIAPAETLTSDALWVLLQALAEVRVARDALDGAAGDVLTLSRDAEWRSDGVAALRDTLGDLATRTRVAAADAGLHETRIASVSA